MSAPTVFISYSHDSPEHSERVRQLSASLSRDGCECRVDVFKESDEDWPSWMTKQLPEADFILSVVSEVYERRFHDKELPDVGKGVGWEAGLIRRLLYAKKLHNDRVIPVIFAKSDEQYIPIELQGYDFFVLDGKAGYETLLRKILNRPLYAAPEVGTPPELDTEATRPLFERPTGKIRGTPAEKEGARYDISRIIKYAPAELIGRENELKILSDAWQQAINKEKKRPYILTFVALGGEGKTSIVAKWAAGLAHQDWPGCDVAFGWSFYSQGTSDKTQASSDTFLAEALRFFGDEETAGSAKGAYEKAKRLARLIAEKRALLVLDGVEPLQYAPGPPMNGKLKDEGVAALLRSLAATNRGVCIVTTRYSVPDLAAFWQTTAPEIKLTSLSREAGAFLLKALGVKGTEEEFESLVSGVRGHALTLNLLGAFLRDAYGGDIRKRDLVKLEEADTEEQRGHAFHVMDAYVACFKSEGESGRRALAMLRLLGLFDRPASAEWLTALWTGKEIGGLTGPLLGLSEVQRNITLKRLEEANLITVNRDKASAVLISLDAHPLVREYFATRVREQLPGAWRAAHRRLFEYLCNNTKEGKRPTLEDLQPLYQAIFHGCQAGLHHEACRFVYVDRILQGKEHYSWHKLGAFGSEIGAQACMFEVPWTTVSSKLSHQVQPWLLNEAAFCLRALGRLTEAREPLTVGLEMRVQQAVWDSAANMAYNLSELELIMGDIDRATITAEKGVQYAANNNDWMSNLTVLTGYAKVLNSAGLRSKAQSCYQEAERNQREHQPDYPFLYEVQGAQYGDLLLLDAERIGWQVMLKHADPFMSPEQTITICKDVYHRAHQALGWGEMSEGASLLGTGLQRLILGRALFYPLLLKRSAELDSVVPGSEDWANVSVTIETALDEVRRAGQQDEYPTALITHAWTSFVANFHVTAQADLEEAWEIAERGPMRLHMADIHLYRARLFHAVQPYPWNKFEDGSEGRGPKDDLADARKLIERCGYWRRKDELEDAEEAAKNWD